MGGRGAYLQKLAAMQLSQLDRAVLTSVTFSCASPITSLLARCETTLLATAPLSFSHVPGSRLLAIATSIEGILALAMLRGVSIERFQVQSIEVRIWWSESFEGPMCRGTGASSVVVQKGDVICSSQARSRMVVCLRQELVKLGGGLGEECQVVCSVVLCHSHT